MQHWGKTGDRFHRKTKGKSLMLSGFICPCHGRFEVTADQVPEFEKFCKEKHPDVTFTKKSEDAGGGHSSLTHVEPGKNGDGWWTGENVVDQTREVVPIFDFVHRGKVGMFIYDNSTNHSCYPPGALGILPGVNKGPGGINAPGAVLAGEEDTPSWAPKSHRPKMVDGWFLAADGATRVAQSMHEPDKPGNPTLGEPPTVPGRFKGTEAILRERGHFSGGAAAKGDCKQKAADARPEEQCCCKHMLAAEPDFEAQPTALEELLVAFGHLHKMLPKCHPELNPIEQFWAALKEYLRRKCGYSFAKLKDNLPGAVRCVPLAQVQRYFRRAERFMQLYLQEATLGVDLPGEVRAFAMKKYKRHRGVPASLLSDLQSAFEAKQGKLQERKRRGQGKAEAVQAKILRVKGMLGALAAATKQQAAPPPS